MIEIVKVSLCFACKRIYRWARSYNLPWNVFVYQGLHGGAGLMLGCCGQNTETFKIEQRLQRGYRTACLVYMNMLWTSTHHIYYCYICLAIYRSPRKFENNNTFVRSMKCMIYLSWFYISFWLSNKYLKHIWANYICRLEEWAKQM